MISALLSCLCVLGLSEACDALAGSPRGPLLPARLGAVPRLFSVHSVHTISIPAFRPVIHRSFGVGFSNLFCFPGSHESQLLQTSSVFIGLFGTYHFVF